MIIDAHCHVGLSWYEPLEALLFQMDRLEVERAVLVQVWNELDNTYQDDCVRAHPDRLASIAMLDTTSPDAPQVAEKVVANGAHGIRLRPSTRSPGDDPWLIWRKAAELGTTVSCVGSPTDFASSGFAEIVQEFATLPIVIEHLAEVLPLSADYSSEEAERVLALSAHENVYMKFHGLGEFSQRVRSPADGFPFERPVPSLLRETVDAFGADHLMWGSDFPPVSKREGYANALAFSRAELSHLSAQDQDLMFGGVARRLYWQGA